MKTKIYYSLKNNGDGSAGLDLMESQELADLEQESEMNDGDGFAENCSGSITIEHHLPIKILDDIKTVVGMIKEITDEHDKYGGNYPTEKMAALVKLKDNRESTQEDNTEK